LIIDRDKNGAKVLAFTCNKKKDKPRKIRIKRKFYELKSVKLFGPIHKTVAKLRRRGPTQPVNTLDFVL
jgi:hypothetical protein